MCVYMWVCAEVSVRIYMQMCICGHAHVYILSLCILLSTGTVPLNAYCVCRKCIYYSPDRVLYIYIDPDFFDVLLAAVTHTFL